ncbi:DUF4430 domain-containing protein [Candidatus Bathyarchaeota archaeon]|nr:DUF4430 domain-containing protein [Candidatus Bathyarchaeota archaeon]
MALGNKWALASVVLLCWAIAASLLSVYYYYQYSDLAARVGEVTINLGIDYGNGTRIWYNGTKGSTLYDAMVNAGWEIKSTDYGVMGLYINAINGLEESASDYKYWGWWSWTDFGWSHGGTACDKYVPSPGETILWYYSPVDPTTFEYAPPP